MNSTSLTFNQRFGRLTLGVVMAALLFMSALQVVEAGHLHLEVESASECLLCSDTLKVGLSTSLTSNKVFFGQRSKPVISVYHELSLRLLLPPSRAPPVFS